MEAIGAHKRKTDIATGKGYESFAALTLAYKDKKMTTGQYLDVVDEVISEVAKRVAEATKQSCAEKAKCTTVSVAWYEVDKESILNAPIPEIK